MNPLVEYGDTLNWNYVFRERFDGQPDPSKPAVPVPDTILNLSYRILLIGVTSTKAQAHWRRGAIATCSFRFSPSSTSIIPGGPESVRKTCYLGKFVLLELPRYNLPYQLKIEVFHWLPDVALEVWYYDGPDSDTTTAALARIEAKLAEIAENVQIEIEFEE